MNIKQNLITPKRQKSFRKIFSWAAPGGEREKKEVQDKRKKKI